MFYSTIKQDVDVSILNIKKVVRIELLASWKHYFLLFLLAFIIFSTTNWCIVSSEIEMQNQGSLNRFPQRIVVFPLFAEEMLLEMIGPERIVYVGHEYFENGEGYSPMMELAKNIKGRSWNMSDDEDIFALNPDLIIIYDYDLPYFERMFPMLHYTNIPILCITQPTTIDEIQNSLITLGGIVGAPKKAMQMVDYLKNNLTYITEITSFVPDEMRIHVFHYVYYTNDYRSEEEEPFTCWYRQNSFAMTARCAGVFAEGPDIEDPVYGEPEDWLIEANPDIITFDYAYYDTDGSIFDLTGIYHDTIINDLLNNRRLSNIKAIKNHAIFPVRIFESQLIVQSAIDLAQLAYPDLFP